MLENTSVLQINKNKMIAAFWFLLAARLIAMLFIPLNDSTEARYAEIARIMLETGDWITPMQEYGVPFWAKPPLSTWLTAMSMALFGVNEFAARLPAMILSVGVLWLVWYVAKLRHGANFALISCLILSGSIFFYLDAGAVMTDPALLFATSLTFFAFWLAITENRKNWGYIFFIGLGIGMLAKGPVAWVLTGLPIGIWVLINKKLRQVWENLPWFSGLLLSFVIFMPWYLLAERKTPGFLNYFIVGENINRFLKPGWEGDMYGGAHLAPYGYIWIYALIGIFPWIIPFFVILSKNFRSIFISRNLKSEWISYLLICMLMPLVFFTFASNIIYPYVFPILPFFALLFAELIITYSKTNSLALVASSSGVIFLILLCMFVYKPSYVEKSQKRMIALYNAHRKNDSHLIYWLPKADYSARFYSQGKVIATNKQDELEKYIKNKDNFFVINTKYLRDLSPELRKHFHAVSDMKMGNNRYLLLKVG